MISFTVRIPMSALMPRHEEKAALVDGKYDHPWEDRMVVLPHPSRCYIEFDVEDVLPDLDPGDTSKYVHPHLTAATAWPMKNPRLVVEPS